MNGYQISPRVTLQLGDRFRVSGGPYWRSAGGEKIPMGSRGLFVLVDVLRQRSRVYLLAVGREGFALLHVEGRRRNRSMPALVCRPYRVRPAKKIRTARKKQLPAA